MSNAKKQRPLCKDAKRDPTEVRDGSTTVIVVEARRAQKAPSAASCVPPLMPPLLPNPSGDRIIVLDTFASGTLPLVPPPTTPCLYPLPPLPSLEGTGSTLPASAIVPSAAGPLGPASIAGSLPFSFSACPCRPLIAPPGPPQIAPLQFYPFTVPGVITADDGVVTPAVPGVGGVQIASQPFTQSIPPVGVDGPVPTGTLDHPKFLALTQCAFPIVGTPEIETYFEVEAAAFTQGTQNNPFGAPFVADPFDDLRLAASALVTIDLNTFMVADMFFTNGGVYALYERLESGRTPTNNYASFTDAVKVATRDRVNPANDVVNVGIGWTSQAIRWYVNRREVRRIDRIGFRAPNYQQVVLIDRGGQDQLVVPQSVSVGLGNFTLLDAFRPNNFAGTYVPGLTFNNPLVLLSSIPGLYRNPFVVDPVTGEFVPLDPADFVDPLDLSESRIFGQGATFIVRYLLAALRSVPKSI
jgi:hypothetical protein